MVVDTTLMGSAKRVVITGNDCKGLHNPLQYLILNKTTKGYIIWSKVCQKNRKSLWIFYFLKFFIPVV